MFWNASFNRSVFLLLVLLSYVAQSQAGEGEKIILKGFSTPESVLYDPMTDLYLVSNINGSPTVHDNNGYISRVSPDGKFADKFWIGGEMEGGLDAPKGTAFAGEFLYVADINKIKKFQRGTGQLASVIEIKGATFLNDVSAGKDGQVYVTDSGMGVVQGKFSPTGTDAIYRIAPDDVVTKIAGGKTLNRPNGIFALDSGDLLVCTMNKNHLYRMNPKGEIQKTWKLPEGGLDGIVVTEDGLILVSSWGASAIYWIAENGAMNRSRSGIPSPADIGYDTKRRRILVPVFNEDRLEIHPR